MSGLTWARERNQEDFGTIYQGVQILSGDTVKIFINRSLSEIELGDRTGEFSRPGRIVELNREKTDSSFLARIQPVKSHGLFVG